MSEANKKFVIEYEGKRYETVPYMGGDAQTLHLCTSDTHGEPPNYCVVKVPMKDGCLAVRQLPVRTFVKPKETLPCAEGYGKELKDKIFIERNGKRYVVLPVTEDGANSVPLMLKDADNVCGPTLHADLEILGVHGRMEIREETAAERLAKALSAHEGTYHHEYAYQVFMANPDEAYGGTWYTITDWAQDEGTALRRFEIAKNNEPQFCACKSRLVRRCVSDIEVAEEVKVEKTESEGGR